MRLHCLGEVQPAASGTGRGREVSGFDEERWTQARYAIVRAGSVAKFSAHPKLLAG